MLAGSPPPIGSLMTRNVRDANGKAIAVEAPTMTKMVFDSLNTDDEAGSFFISSSRMLIAGSWL